MSLVLPPGVFDVVFVVLFLSFLFCLLFSTSLLLTARSDTIVMVDWALPG